MTSLNTIPEFVQFRQELNDMIDEVINRLKSGDYRYEGNIKTIAQTLTYFNRIKNFNNCTKEDDDEEDDNEENVDDLFLSDEDEDEYTKIMRNHIYYNKDNMISDKNQDCYKSLKGTFRDDDFKYDKHYVLSNISEDINRQILGLNDDNSVDPPIYGDSDHNDDIINDEDLFFNSDTSGTSDDEHNNHILNNNKKTLKNFIVNPDIEITDENIKINYDEPII